MSKLSFSSYCSISKKNYLLNVIVWVSFTMFPCLGIQPRWFHLLSSDLIWIFLLTYFVLTDVGCGTINKINNIIGSLGTIIESFCEFMVFF